MTICSLVWGRDYFVRHVDLGTNKIGGYCDSNHDGTYNIYINSRLFAWQVWPSFLHELAHCALGHLDERSYLSKEEKEREAEEYKYKVPVIIPVDAAGG